MRKLARGSLIVGLLVASLGLVGTSYGCRDATGPLCKLTDSLCTHHSECCSRNCLPSGLTDIAGTCS